MPTDIKPEDIDFPVSDTFWAGLCELHGWPVPPRCETLQEARAREDAERIRAAHEEAEPPTWGKEALAKVWHKVRQLEAENAYLHTKLRKYEQERQPKPIHGIEGL